MESSTVHLRSQYDYLAPDQSEIRLLSQGKSGGLCHCTLPAGRTSLAVKHRHVEELWSVLDGEGEIWRDGLEGGAPIKVVRPSSSVFIPSRTGFQFRAGSAGPLQILIATMPRWPGAEEAEPTKGFWQ